MAYTNNATANILQDIYLKNMTATLFALKNRCDEPSISIKDVYRRLEAAYYKACVEGLFNKNCVTTYFPTDFYDKKTHEKIFCCVVPHRPPVGKPHQTFVFSGWHRIGEGPLQTVHYINGIRKQRSIWEALKYTLGIAA